jgi:hypothetical protein
MPTAEKLLYPDVDRSRERPLASQPTASAMKAGRNFVTSGLLLLFS